MGIRDAISTGLKDQMYRGDGGPQRFPPPPRQANTLVVGGPAYFTPEGYQAPIQPEQSFMPTNRAPDPIGDQFRRANPPPPAQTAPPPPPPPPPSPVPDPEPIIDPVEEPVVEPDFPIYGGPAQPYIPGVTPFPGIPGLGDLDFSGLPGMGDIDIDAIIQEYQDRIDAGEPEPFDSFLPTQPDPRDIAYASVGGPGGPPPDPPQSYIDVNGNLQFGNPPSYTMGPMGQADSNTVAPEPDFVPPPQEPNGFFPGIDTRDFEDFNFGEEMMDDYDFGNPNLRNMRGFDPRR